MDYCWIKELLDVTDIEMEMFETGSFASCIRNDKVELFIQGF